MIKFKKNKKQKQKIKNKAQTCNHLFGHHLEFDLHYEHELYKPFLPKNIIKIYTNYPTTLKSLQKIDY